MLIVHLSLLELIPLIFIPAIDDPVEDALEVADAILMTIVVEAEAMSILIELAVVLAMSIEAIVVIESITDVAVITMLDIVDISPIVELEAAIALDPMSIPSIFFYWTKMRMIYWLNIKMKKIVIILCLST